MLNEGMNQNAAVTDAIAYLRQGRSAEAFLILSEPGNEKNPAARYALGLCHYKAGDLPAAISCFDQALSLLRTMPSKHRSAAENTETYLMLSKGQIADKIFLNPMDSSFCALFPKTAEQTIILASIEIYLQMGMKDKAKQLSAGLTGSVFEIYKNELLKI